MLEWRTQVPVETPLRTLPPVRFTVRRLMAAVAVVAIAMGAAKLWARRNHCQWMAADYAVKERFIRVILRGKGGHPKLTAEDGRSYMMDDDYWKYRTAVGLMPNGVVGFTVYQFDPIPSADALREQAALYSELAKGYSRVARFPFLPLPTERVPP